MPYSITTKDGITINNIPDDVAPDSQELKDRVARIRAGETEAPREAKPATPREAPSLASVLRPEFMNPELGRQAGLTARMIPGGLANVAGLVGDPLNALVNLITGSKLQTIGGAAENLMTQAGLPEPREGLERGIYNVGTSVVGAAGPAALANRLTRQASQAVPRPRIEPSFAQQNIVQPVAQAFGGNVGLQTTGAAGASLASQLAGQAGAGTFGQLGAGLLGGVVAPATLQTAGSRTTAGAREAVRPFTEAGREVIAGNVLRQLSAEPDVAALRAGSFEPRVPGYTPTTAQATRDVGLISAETPIRSFDATGRFAAQASQANQARMTVLDRLAKDKDALNAAIAKRDEIATPLREQAFAQSAVTPEVLQASVNNTVVKTIDNILASSAGARQPVKNAMQFARERLQDGTTPERLYEVRKDLRDAAQGLLNKEGSAYNLAKKELESVIKSVDNVLEAEAPGYKNYLSKYAASSRGIERLEAVQDFRKKVLTTTPDPGRVSDYLISQPAFTRAIRALKDDPKLGGLSKTQFAVLERVSKDLDDGVLARATKVPGSDTFKNMSTANLIGGIVGKQVFGELSPALQSKINPFNWMYGGSDEAIKELLVDAMLDPKLAAKLMQKATTTSVEPISKELQRRAINLGYGSIFGLTE